jgi:signal transduction histidine kinase
LGLGLALSRQTVLDHGGEIWIDQRIDLGLPGARFIIRLPLRKPPAGAVAPDRAPHRSMS